MIEQDNKKWYGLKQGYICEQCGADINVVGMVGSIHYDGEKVFGEIKWCGACNHEIKIESKRVGQNAKLWR